MPAFTFDALLKGPTETLFPSFQRKRESRASRYVFPRLIWVEVTRFSTFYDRIQFKNRIAGKNSRAILDFMLDRREIIFMDLFLNQRGKW